MKSNNRRLINKPIIPDHEVLRQIGSGSYGDVWMARAVTGALRAVKVLRREDFDDEKSFEREFEGLLKYEPISREHPGLVHVLHVGRGIDSSPFYYYVMELGDDAFHGKQIIPEEYEVRTLRSDHQRMNRQISSLEECLAVGLRLSETLAYLHDQGLAHRDIKPANIIFVGGKAKLADIGLVAARGQNTFVGTEGFVPPEGPGTTQADVYALGKVLYEMLTGKDRLDFPELPEDLPEGTDRKRWFELNELICHACDPRLSKRKDIKASHLATVLKQIESGIRKPIVSKRVWWIGAAVISMAVSFSLWLYHSAARKEKIGWVRVVSFPEGAEVFDGENNQLLGVTPTNLLSYDVGKKLSLILKKRGYRVFEVVGELSKDSINEPLVLQAEMKVFAPPIKGEIWKDHLDLAYLPQGEFHMSSGYISKEAWLSYVSSTRISIQQVDMLKASQYGMMQEIVLTTREQAQKYANWVVEEGRRAGLLTDDYQICANMDEDFSDSTMSETQQLMNLKPFKLKVEMIPYGRINLTTNPSGASVFIDEKSVGISDNTLLIPKIKPGNVQLKVILEGHRVHTQTLEIIENSVSDLVIDLETNQGVIFSKSWKNSLGMKMLPMRDDLLVSIWETRVKDYSAFQKDSKRAIEAKVHFQQDDNHPVVMVSREDAEEFCKWLTIKDRKADLIGPKNRYRLPTDLEWSQMAGLTEEESKSPAWRDVRKKQIFPWGKAWPPIPKSGNFADQSSDDKQKGENETQRIPGYKDEHVFTSSVGTFPENELGLFDLFGNAQEWVSDDYSSTSNRLGVLRGAGWTSYQPASLYIGARNMVPNKYRDAMYGFRVVLSKY